MGTAEDKRILDLPEKRLYEGCNQQLIFFGKDSEIFAEGEGSPQQFEIPQKPKHKGKGSWKGKEKQDLLAESENQ